jgi:hypothetical protein
MVFTVREVIDGAWERQRLKDAPVFPPPVKGVSVFQDVFDSLAEGLGDLLLRRGYGGGVVLSHQFPGPN